MDPLPLSLLSHKWCLFWPSRIAPFANCPKFLLFQELSHSLVNTGDFLWLGGKKWLLSLSLKTPPCLLQWTQVPDQNLLCTVISKQEQNPYMVLKTWQAPLLFPEALLWEPPPSPRQWYHGFRSSQCSLKQWDSSSRERESKPQWGSRPGALLKVLGLVGFSNSMQRSKELVQSCQPAMYVEYYTFSFPPMEIFSVIQVSISVLCASQLNFC